MEPVWVLTLLSLSMLAGCYLAGIIPLVMPMSEDRLEVVTVLGAGLLVGTALTVIIPEGVNTLLSAHMELHLVTWKGQPTAAKNKPYPNLSNTTFSSRINIWHLGTASAAHERDPHDHSSSEHMEPHTVVGVSLLLGFLLMLLIDQCAGGHPKPDTENGGAKGRRASMTATLGLVVHAAADGIALGAAAASSHTDVEMIVFFAIMLHKAPAAFGLVTFLLHEGLERNKIRRHLLVFALAAPIGAVGTFLSIVQSGSESFSSAHNTGVAMLFSAGTFLYVSTVHVLPELTGHDGGGQFSRKQLLALVCGSILPLFLAIGHHH
ncbi:zinc/iron regulated transporter-related protein 102B isoform X3 [Oratosquilla oratoria]|uniref:zinc/iron regulated transporter-related protein 102B isoform X3 n=1 Tax=Oratosquilla oratoria TaxID=337810 RepID=UPI003F775F24